MSSTKIKLLLLVSLLLHVYLGLSAAKTLQSKKKLNSKNGSLKSEFATVGFEFVKTNSYYIVPISFGSILDEQVVPQKFNVLLDIGKPDFWIIDRYCPDAFCESTNRTFYQRNKSPTYVDTKKSVSVDYFYKKYQISGISSQDIFNVETASLELDHQDFIRATKVTKFTDEPYDGIWGLAYNPTIKPNTRLTVLENLYEQRQLGQKVFSIRINADNGNLILGGVDGGLYIASTLFYVNVATQGVWDFKPTSISVVGGANTLVLENKPVKVRIETILPNIGVPKSQLGKIATYVGATYVTSRKAYVVSCDVLTDNTKSLVLTINTNTLTIPPSAYILSDGAATPTCTLNLSEQSGWILGQKFLELYYTIYEASNYYTRIGFANYDP